MSHIFEALQRAEAERSGGKNSIKVSESAVDLLELALAQGEEQANSAAVVIRGVTAERRDPEILSAARLVVPAPASDAHLVCLTDQGSLAAEKFRVLGLRMRNLREKRPCKRIVVTSTIPEEGKTLTSANLALNQSRSKVMRTVLVDGDLRRPAVTSRFGLSRSLPGLTDCLSGDKQLSEVLCKLQGTNLWFVPAGLPPDNPLELMQSGRVADLFESLGKVFDWVIIDSPPVIPLADASFWMKLSDGVLLVVREGVSEKVPLKRALEIIDRSNLLGVVVNSYSSGDHKNYYQRYKAASADSGDSPYAENE